MTAGHHCHALGPDRRQAPLHPGGWGHHPRPVLFAQSILAVCCHPVLHQGGRLTSASKGAFWAFGYALRRLGRASCTPGLLPAAMLLQACLIPQLLPRHPGHQACLLVAAVIQITMQLLPAQLVHGGTDSLTPMATHHQVAEFCGRADACLRGRRSGTLRARALWTSSGCPRKRCPATLAARAAP